MEEARAGRIANIYNSIKSLGKNIKLPGATNVSQNAPQVRNAIGIPVQGSGFTRIAMYFIAGLLMIGIILLVVDQWVTPIFQRSPGAPGYIAIPGTDLTQSFWSSAIGVRDIVIGTPSKSVVPPGYPQPPTPLSVTVIEGQSSYSITMDILINDQYSQTLPAGKSQRVFFVMSQTVENPSLQISLDNAKNTVYITCFDSNGYQQSVTIDNVPVFTPFRLGLTMSSYAMEGYLNGMLVKTRQLDSTPINPTTGDKIFAPANIKANEVVLSKGIDILNIRAFGYVASPAEMKARMSDLSSKSSFKMVF